LCIILYECGLRLATWEDKLKKKEDLLDRITSIRDGNMADINAEAICVAFLSGSFRDFLRDFEDSQLKKKVDGHRMVIVHIPHLTSTMS